LADATDQRWDEFTLLEAALIASGAEQAGELHACTKAMRAHAARLAGEAAHDASPRDRAISVQRYLHREVLLGPYDANCNDLRRTLSEGRYNCVTATVLYLVLAESLHLQVTAVHLPGHVRCRLRDGVMLDIETTRPEASAALLTTESVAANKRGRELSATALVGKLYYNAGLALMERGEVSAAVTKFEHSLTLDPRDAAAQQNLLAALNNGALAFCERRQFETASAYLARVEQLAPNFPALTANDLHVHGQWVTALCERREYSRALDILQAGALRQPQAPLYREGHVAVYRLWVEDLLARGESHAALAKVTQALAHSPGHPQLVELRKRVETLAAPRL
jgi:tetratricopeptide (TPR) repeat protein